MCSRFGLGVAERAARRSRSMSYEVYVRQSIELGVADAVAGRLLEHDDAMVRIRNRIRRAS